jgi:hypothetical protein
MSSLVINLVSGIVSGTKRDCTCTARTVVVNLKGGGQGFIGFSKLGDLSDELIVDA